MRFDQGDQCAVTPPPECIQDILDMVSAAGVRAEGVFDGVCFRVCEGVFDGLRVCVREVSEGV